ncbi:hypothetical protein GCM10025856_13220 [Methylophaga marina]|uniref:restriction system-associated AAA family ATPase n=1 Tax=Methylophaga marina TaxID=45495 RepID=UPI0025733AF0|nr:restriction system-associated AAA family ATPase [Methylophaga marina]BDZ73603.1 hypothetical protein GCM10025856_13220 [Methylophaga marina]
MPDTFIDDGDVALNSDESSNGGEDTLNAYELEYLIKVSDDLRSQTSPLFAEVSVRKSLDGTPQIFWKNYAGFDLDEQDLKRLNNQQGLAGDKERDFLLPAYVLGYSSGENEILSLPFFKMRFIQFDEYWYSLEEQLPYSGKPETRMTYMDSSFSQAILLCNLLYGEAESLKLFQQDLGLGELQEFRIILKRSIEITAQQAEVFGLDHPAVTVDDEFDVYTLNLLDLLEADKNSAERFDPTVNRLKRCATSYFLDETTDTLYLDYCVNDKTKKAFAENFSFGVNKSPIDLFQAFQVLLTLNLYPVSEELKADLYQSDSHYVSETVPVLASDERIMRFKFFRFNKQGIKQPIMLKNLSDGEH